MSEDPHDDPTDEGMAALSAVRSMAYERAGHNPGFDCVLAYLSDDMLREVNPGYTTSLFLNKEERTRRIAASFDSPEVRLETIVKILNLAAKSDDTSAADLSKRILARMGATKRGDRMARPMFYVLAAESGIAIALAIHDEFWTEKW